MNHRTFIYTYSASTLPGGIREYLGSINAPTWYDAREELRRRHPEVLDLELKEADAAPDDSVTVVVQETSPRSIVRDARRSTLLEVRDLLYAHDHLDAGILVAALVEKEGLL